MNESGHRATTLRSSSTSLNRRRRRRSDQRTERRIGGAPRFARPNRPQKVPMIVGRIVFEARSEIGFNILYSRRGGGTVYRARNKGMHILLSNSQAEQLSKSRKKFLATMYHPFSRSLYLDSNLRLQKMDQASQTDNRKLGSSLLTRHWSNTCALVRRIIKNRSRGRSESLSYRLYP